MGSGLGPGEVVVHCTAGQGLRGRKGLSGRRLVGLSFPTCGEHSPPGLDGGRAGGGGVSAAPWWGGRELLVLPLLGHS